MRLNLFLSRVLRFLHIHRFQFLKYSSNSNHQVENRIILCQTKIMHKLSTYYNLQKLHHRRISKNCKLKILRNQAGIYQCTDRILSNPNHHSPVLELNLSVLWYIKRDFYERTQLPLSRLYRDQHFRISSMLNLLLLLLR